MLRHISKILTVSLATGIVTCSLGQSPTPVTNAIAATPSNSWPTVNLNLLLLRGIAGHADSDSHPTFRLTEDRASRPIETISGPGSPVSLCVAVRISSSGRLADVERNAAAFLVENLPAGSEVMIVFVADKAYLALPFTPAETALEHFPNANKLAGSTHSAFVHAVSMVESYFAHNAHFPRRALVLIASSVPIVHFDDALRSMLTPGSPFVYLLYPAPHPGMGFGPETQLAKNVRDEFVKPAGGLSFPVDMRRDQDSLMTQVGEISRDIASQYAVTYTSDLTEWNDQFHQVSVSLLPEDSHLKIQSQPGYYLPNNEPATRHGARPAEVPPAAQDHP